jgi:hypothetical protein
MDWRVATLVWITRLTGLGLVVYFLRPVLLFAATLVGYVRTPPMNGFAPTGTAWSPLQWVEHLLPALASVVLLALGLHMLLGGRWLLRRMLRGLDGSCPACGHPWPDAGAVRCPECGFGAMVVVRRERVARSGEPRSAPEEGLP